ncbi:MAG: hypothetical protein J6M20_01160 [Clostridia bacterium]|nr:hypothetical protein [Clostridia bacterium]
MREQIIKILMDELKYSRYSAEVTSDDLLAIQDDDIRKALMRWLALREMTPVSAEGYDAVQLTDRMSYPSALLAIELLKKEPLVAKKMLKGFR